MSNPVLLLYLIIPTSFASLRTTNKFTHCNFKFETNRGNIPLPSPVRDCSWTIPGNSYLTLVKDFPTNYTCDDAVLVITYDGLRMIEYCSWISDMLRVEWWLGEMPIEIKLYVKNDDAISLNFTMVYGPDKLVDFCAGYDSLCTDYSGCYNKANVCDYKKDCTNGEDEWGCEKYCLHQYECSDEYMCYSRQHICDGVANCLDKSDEKNCERRFCKNVINEQGLIVCMDNTCVPKRLGPGACPKTKEKPNTTSSFAISFIIFTLLIIFCFIILRWFASRTNSRNTPRSLVFSPRPFLGSYSDSDTTEISAEDLQSGGHLFETTLSQIREINRRERDRQNREENVEMDIEEIFSAGVDHYTQANAQESRHAPALALASLGIDPSECTEINRDLFLGPKPKPYRLDIVCESERSHRHSSFEKQPSDYNAFGEGIKRPMSDSVREIKKT